MTISLHHLLLLLASLMALSQVAFCNQVQHDPQQPQQARKARGGVKEVSLLEYPAYEAYNEGVAFSRANDDHRAIDAYQKAIQIKPDLCEAHQNLGNIYGKLGDLAKAEESHRLALEHAADREPSFRASLIVNFVSTRLKRGLNKGYDPAIVNSVISSLKEARSLSPADENVLFNLGSAYYTARQYDDANSTFMSLIAINPNSGLACLNIGNNYFRLRNFKVANEWYNKAIDALSTQDRSNRLTALSNNGQCLRELGRLSDSLDNFREALQFTNKNEIDALDVWLLNCMIAVMAISSTWRDYEKVEELVLRHFASAKDDMIEADGRLDLYTFGLQRYASLPQSLQAAKLGCPYFPLQFFDQGVQHDVEHTRSKDMAIRIGYLSYDWRNHPMGRLTRRLVTSHSRERFHTICISYSKDDKSAERADVRTLCEKFIDLHNLNALTTTDVQQIIAGLELDILIDLTSHTYEGRIDFAASHPYGTKLGGMSTSIINYLGYPGTTGCTRFDYSMIDPRAVPAEFARSFSERLIYLPNSYQANSMLYGAEPCLLHTESGLSLELSLSASECRGRVPASTSIASTLSSSPFSSSSAIWVCSFNANKKFESNSFHVWMNILRRVPGAVLLLMVPDHTKDTLLQELSVHGISISRVIFLPMLTWGHHLYRIAACDLVLDNFVYGAHTTASDMLWMFVPIVTLEAYGSGRMPSRVAAGITRSLFHSRSDENGDSVNRNNVRVGEDLSNLLVVYSVKEYEDVVVRFLSVKDSNDSLSLINYARRSIARRHLLADTFDAQAMQRYVERSYQGVLELNYIESSSQASGKKYHLVLGKDIMRDEGRLLQESLLYLADTLLECSTYLHHVLKGDDAFAESLPVGLMMSLRSIASRLYALPPSVQMDQNDMEILESLLKNQPLSEFLERVCLLFQRIGIDAREILRVRKESPYLLRSISPSSWASWIYASQPPPSSLDSTVYNTCIYYDFNFAVAGDESECVSLEKVAIFFKTESVDSYTKLVARCLHACIRHTGELSAVQRIMLAQNEMLQGDMYEAEDILFKWVSYFFLQELAVLPHTGNDVIDSILVKGIKESEEYYYLVPSNTLGVMMEGANQHENSKVITTLASIVRGHASLFSSRNKRHTQTYLFMASAYVMNPSYDHLQDMGVTLRDVKGFEKQAYLLASEAIYHRHLQRYQHFQDKYSSGGEVDARGISVLTDSSSSSSSSSEVSKSKVVRIAFYCFEYGQDWWPHWGPKASQRKGGSEEAVINLSRAMVAVAQTHISLLSSLSATYQQPVRIEVEMYTDSFQEDLGPDDEGVTWYHHDQFDPENDPPDIFVSWRYPLSMILGKNSKKMYLWLHDVLEHENFYDGFQHHVDGVFVQSDFHRGTLPTFLQEKTIVIPHGLDSNYPPLPLNDAVVNQQRDDKIEIINSNHIFIYASAPNRGLEYVLKLWPFIKEKISTAKLEVYYGFGEKIDIMLSGMMGFSAFHIWKEEMMTLLKQDGIIYKGMVSQQEISIAFKKAGFLLYPTSFPETGCITVMKAMASGVIPITSRYVRSVLFNMTNHFDMGPKEPLESSSYEEYHRWLSSWFDSVLLAATTDEHVLVEKRRSMIKYARSSFSWNQSAVKVFESVFAL